MSFLSGLGSLLAGPAGAVIGAVAPSIIGAISAKKNKKPQETVSKTEFDFEQLRESAEKAGFNPLTALAGAGAPASTTTQTTGTGLSSVDFIAQGVGKGIQAYAAYDPVAKEREALELQLMRADLERINRTPAGVNTTVYGPPSTTSRRGNVTYPTPALAAPATAGGFTEPPKDSRVTVVGMDQNDLAIGGGVFHVNNNSSSAEEWEREYGEAGGFLYGAGRLANDTYQNVAEPVREFNAMQDEFRDPWAERDEERAKAAEARPVPSITLLPPNPLDRFREDEFQRQMTRGSVQ